jgi:hypothetical protein
VSSDVKHLIAPLISKSAIFSATKVDNFSLSVRGVFDFHNFVFLGGNSELDFGKAPSLKSLICLFIVVANEQVFFPARLGDLKQIGAKSKSRSQLL